MDIITELAGIPAETRDAAARGGVIVNPCLITPASAPGELPGTIHRASGVAMIAIGEVQLSDDRGWTVVDQWDGVILAAGLFREEALLAAGWLGFHRVAGDFSSDGIVLAAAFHAWFCGDCGSMREEDQDEHAGELCASCAHDRRLAEAEDAAEDEARELIR